MKFYAYQFLMIWLNQTLDELVASMRGQQAYSALQRGHCEVDSGLGHREQKNQEDVGNEWLSITPEGMLRDPLTQLVEHRTTTVREVPDCTHRSLPFLNLQLWLTGY